MTGVDVVVVGAGAAGIGAGLALRQAGLSCVILEAASRVGGAPSPTPTRCRRPGIMDATGCTAAT